MKTSLSLWQNQGKPLREAHLAPVIELTDSELSSINGGSQGNTVHFHHIVASGPSQQGQLSQIMLQTPYDLSDNMADYPATGCSEWYPYGSLYQGGYLHPLVTTNSDTNSGTQSGGSSSNPTYSSNSGSPTLSNSGSSTTIHNSAKIW